MSTVQANLLKLALRINANTKSGQRFQGSGQGTLITNAVTDSGLIKLTATGHGLVTNQYATVYGVSGVTNANNTAGNPAWKVTVDDANNVTLQASTFSGSFSGSGGIIVGALVGSIDGSRYNRQRLLDIYNEARMALFNALYETKPSSELPKYVYGSVITASIAMTYSAPYMSIAKPTGFIRKISMFDGAATPIEIHILPNELLGDVKRGLVPSITVSATNLLAFDVGQNWSIVGNYGTTPASVTYYGITNWVWATDVLPNTTVEVFSADIEPLLIEIGEAIANEQSNADAIALAKTLLNRKG